MTEPYLRYYLTGSPRRFIAGSLMQKTQSRIPQPNDVGELLAPSHIQ